MAGNKEARKVYNSYRRFRDESLQTMAVAEQSYLNVRRAKVAEAQHESW